MECFIRTTPAYTGSEDGYFFETSDFTEHESMLKLTQITSETKLPTARRSGRGGVFPDWKVVGEVECVKLKSVHTTAERDEIEASGCKGRTYFCLQCPHCSGQVRVLKGSSFHKTKNSIIREHLRNECTRWKYKVPPPKPREKKRTPSDASSVSAQTTLLPWTRKLPSLTDLRINLESTRMNAPEPPRLSETQACAVDILLSTPVVVTGQRFGAGGVPIPTPAVAEVLGGQEEPPMTEEARARSTPETLFDRLKQGSTRSYAPPPHRKASEKTRRHRSLKCRNDRILDWELHGGVRKRKLFDGKNGWQLHLMPYGSNEERAKDKLENRFADVVPSNMLDEVEDPSELAKNTYANTYLFDGAAEDTRGLDRSWNWGNDPERGKRWDYMLAGRW
jgi:hypothetical protein